MVRLNKIYTRTGDTGETGLSDGSRRRKYDLRVATYGDVDEANSAIGIARLYLANDAPTEQGEARSGGVWGEDPQRAKRQQYDPMLERIQQDMFDLGADLSTPDGAKNPLRIIPAQVERLEHEMDTLNEHIPPLNSFVLPGGSPASAHLHMARTITRRAERLACELADRETVNPEAIKYLNRLSDFLFVLARATNHNGAHDILWKPGANR